LTSEGILLRKRAEEIVELVDKAESEFHTSDEIISGDIYICSGETDAIRLIAMAAKKLQNKYPNIRYHLFSGNADDVTEHIDKGLLDFGLLIGSVDIKKYNFITLPSKDTWGLLMRKDSHLAKKDVIKPEDLYDLPLLRSRQALLHNEISGWAKRDFEKLKIVATYNLIYNDSIMVEEGFGYALYLDKLVNTTGNSNLCFKPLYPTLEAPLYIVWKKYQVFSKASETFLKILQG
jgi:DNA-binding transcriptional LysR family regulator